MKFNTTLRAALIAGVAAVALVGCSDTDISSPGAPVTQPPSNPPTTPTPPTTPPSTISLVPSSGCPAGTTESTYASVPADGFSSVDVCTLSGDITSNTTIPAGATIAIEGPVFIGQDGGTTATLTIEAGARLYGASSQGTANATDDYLVVSRGSQIIVNGTEGAPVRMTSRAALNDEETGSSILEEGTTGQWGGLVVNGFAQINACIDGTATGGTAGCEKSGEGASGLFGGADNTDSSGSISYLTVEYAGSRLTNEDELNGIAFQGVGSGTSVDHVQVHNNLDDGIEWFGGAVSARYVVITGAGDDSLDWTDGWVGSLQFAAVYSNVPTSGDPRGIEADNRDGDNTKTPVSFPSLANITLVGTDGNQQGVLLRRGTKVRLGNTIVAGYTPGLDVDSSATFDNFTNGELQIGSMFIDSTQTFAQDGDNPADTSLGVPAGLLTDPTIVAGSNTLIDRMLPGTAELGVTPLDFDDADLVANGGFFEETSYIGAFSPTETLESNWASFALEGTLFPAPTTEPASCPAGTSEDGELAGKTLCVIPTDQALTGVLRLTDGDELIYEVDGTLFVGNDRGSDPSSPTPGSVSGTLIVDPGVTVVAEGNDDYIVVSRGSQLQSNGTAADPVVFTAKGVVDGSVTASNSLKGVWGGLVINGRAPINACIAGDGGTVGCEKSGEGASGLFGGATSDDDSGQLFYTRVQYAGVRLTNEDELNGIAFQGVGSGTDVSFIQGTNNLDDGIEWFGGTVSADHVVITGVGDDSLDWTDGWVGSLQYAIVYPGVGGADGAMSGDPRGIEADNRDGTNDKTPFSDPKVSNFTLINSGDASTQQGMLLRRGTRGVMANGIIADWSVGLDVDSGQTFDNFLDGTLQIKSIFLDNVENFGAASNGDSDGVPAFAATDNIVEGTKQLSGTTFVPGASGFVPGTNESNVPVFDVTGIGELEATTFIGAVEDASDTWYAGWTVNIAGQTVN